MESVETRKLGKHLFIFEKGKAKDGNGKAKGRTLITSCQTEDGDHKLPPEFVKYMRTLFDILDEKNTGFVKLNDLETCWSKNNDDSSSHGTGALEQLRKLTPANGLISFDLLCVGFGQALQSKEGISIRHDSTGQNPEPKPASKKNGFVFNQTLAEQRSAVPAVAQVNKRQDTKSFPLVPGKLSEFSKTNEIRESTVSKTEKGLNHKPKTEQKRPKVMGHKTNEPKKSVHWSSAINDSYRYGIERRSRPMSMGSFGQPHEETTHLYPSQVYSHKSSKNCQNPEHELCKTDAAVFMPKPEVRRRPRSMVPFGEQKQAVDLSVARKEGGILEGLQKTDKKAVIDKLKQWRNEELKKGGQGERGVTKESYRVAHGYQSDNEGNRIMRHKSAVAPVCHSGNEPDFERLHSSTHSSSKINGGLRSPKTTVYYQGQIRNNAETSDSSLKTTERREESKTIRDTKDTKDVSRPADEFRVLKEGLRIVDEVRDCLVKRIADIQEQKLYAQLNNVSSDKTDTIHDQDVNSITSEERKSIGKAGILFDSSHIESLTTHFKCLKTVLDEVKKPKTDG